jgi:manganese transport protein
VMVMLIILAFAITLFLIKPDLGSIASGLVPTSFSFGNEAFIAALVATTFSLPTAMYQSYLMKDKNWKVDDINKGRSSATMGILMLCLITMMIIITAAAALQPKGIEVKSAADMAVQLEVLFGSYAKYVFSIGLCAASFSSLMVNAVIGGGVLSDSLGLGRSMNEKMPRIFTVAILLIGMLIAVFFKGNLVYALIMAQASSIIGVPLIAISILLVLNNKSIMGKYTNSKGENVIGIFGLLLISIMVYFMFSKLIGFFGQI